MDGQWTGSGVTLIDVQWAGSDITLMDGQLAGSGVTLIDGQWVGSGVTLIDALLYSKYRLALPRITIWRFSDIGIGIKLAVFSWWAQLTSRHTRDLCDPGECAHWTGHRVCGTIRAVVTNWTLIIATE